MAYAEPIQRLIQLLGRLPGVGERTAERLAFHILSLPQEEALAYADAIRDLRTAIKRCSICCGVTERDPCFLCSNPKRDQSTVCVVETHNDLWAIEKSASFHGVYHVLGGRIAPLDGRGPEHLTIARLTDRIKQGVIKEVIMATNPTVEGDGTAIYLQRILQSFQVRITRIAKGIPTGSNLEYANRAILSDALEGRKPLL